MEQKKKKTLIICLVSVVVGSCVLSVIIGLALWFYIEVIKKPYMDPLDEILEMKPSVTQSDVPLSQTDFFIPS